MSPRPAAKPAFDVWIEQRYDLHVGLKWRIRCIAVIIGFGLTATHLCQSSAEVQSSANLDFHDNALRATPPDVQLTIELPKGATGECRPGDWITLKVSVSSTKPGKYTAETLTHQNAAGSQDMLILQSLSTGQIIPAKSLGGAICCDSRRVTVRKRPASFLTQVAIPKVWPPPPPLSPMPYDKTTPYPPAGEYRAYLVTRRVMLGLPKNSKELYQDPGNLRVTSENVVTIRIVPNASEGK